jgi:hypothetical protein
MMAVALVIDCDQVRKETRSAAARSRPVEPGPAQPVVARRAPAKAPAPVWIGDAYTACRSSSAGLVGKTVQVTGRVHRFKTTAAGDTFVELDGDADSVWTISCHFPYPLFAVGSLTVRGTITQANNQGGSISMDHCELVD